MADASAISFVFDGLFILHGGPLDDASGFVFFREIYGHLDGRLKDLGIDLFGRMLAWVIATATLLLTLWVWIEGYRIVIGRSQRSMTAFATEAMQAVMITAIATGSALGGGTLYDWVGHDLGRLVHRVLTGQDGDVFEAIDRTLGYMQMAFGFIDEIQAGDNEALQNAKYRNQGLVALGMGGPAVVAGSLLLMYKAMLALCLGFAPLFVLCLLFPQTKPLFWGWLNHLVGTLFALSVLHVMAAIATNMICAVAATFWTAKLTGASVEGVNSLAMQQGGLGLLLTTLIFGAPAIAAKFFKGLLGDFSPYSAFGQGGASQTSAAHSLHSHAPTYMHSGERTQASVQTHAHRVATPARTVAQEDRIKPVEDERSFLERYPNATASLDNSTHRGDPLPASLSSANAYKSGLSYGEEVDALIAHSPTLQGDIKKLREQSWKFSYGQNGAGSFVDRNDSRNPRIVIDGNKRGDAEEVLRALTHEVGHAEFPYRADYSSKEAYVRGALIDESAALIKNIQIRREILDASNGALDIGLNASAVNHKVYEAAYDQYMIDGDKSKALRSISKVFGGEVTRTRDGRTVTYSEYYGEHYGASKK
ncbi:type IV secretion system protein [Luteimonas sp. SX5]|uniref:Type IV secretion system protein n=1 Tax=Luteimonas galliterrae TaxID=2940486 RepID=A0ABT0MLN7_9GAMM|nr:type IV secretion system protein [Luteimonas galliterrae]MCL1635573.1 type IV secretion system protein [Luteimonas galliterrae]